MVERVANYPKASKNQNRNVIWLDSKTNEVNYKVEIIAEIEGMKDCNDVFYAADFKEEDLKGWGYTYFLLENLSPPMSTEIGCFDQTKTMANLPIMISNSFIEYNSKLPIIIYAPKEVNISYKIWSTDDIKHKSLID